MMMHALLKHFKDMQGVVSQYLGPDPVTGDEPVARDRKVIDVLVRMLHGQEQRDAEAAARGTLEQLQQAEDWRMDIRKQVEQADVVARGWKERTDGLLKENNELRERLLASELAYAKLAGYVEGTRDAQPPVMTPQQREPHFASMPDGTMGTQYASWRGGEPKPKPWVHR